MVNGHQWSGDNVSVKRWRDICRSECLASYSRWLWDEHRGVNVDRRYHRLVNRDALRDVLEHKAGVDLTSFWDEWVLSTGRPSDANLFPGDL